MLIRTVNVEDAKAIVDIYNDYVENSMITFETEKVSVNEMAQRIVEQGQQALPWEVATTNLGEVLGYAYASKWKGRCAYRHSVEVTIYLAKSAHGQGIGSQLYQALFKALKAANYHVAIAGISLPNKASIRLHEKFGMEQVAHFKEVGFKFNQWIDVGYWQTILN